MRRRTLAAAKTAASLAVAFGAVIIVTAALVGVAITSKELDDYDGH